MEARLGSAYLQATEDIFRNTFRDIRYILETLGKTHGTRFEFECYDIGHLYNLAYFVEQGLVKPPFLIQSVFGVMGGIGADPENVLLMKQTADRLFGKDYVWSLFAAGRQQMPFVTMGAVMAPTCAWAWRTTCSWDAASSPRRTPSRSPRSAAS